MDHIEEITLHSYADGELKESELYSVESHIRNCLSCSAAYKEILSLKQAISESGLLQPSKNFSDVIMARIASLPTISAVKQKNDILFKLPYLFAATLGAMILIIIMLTDPDTQSTSSTQEKSEILLNENSRIIEYSLNAYEYGNSLFGNFIGSGTEMLGGTSSLIMMLVFAGSILIYQMFEYFRDRIRKQNQIMSLLIL